MNKLHWNRGGSSQSYRLSGGVLQVPKTPAERLALHCRLARLRAEFLARQETRVNGNK